MTFRHSIEIRLKGPNNLTYSGILTLKNHSAFISPPTTETSTAAMDEYDQNGASYYVIAVVLVYGMSIVMLIASHIRRRHAKMQEDKQINKYLNDFQIVRDKQERDNYKALKTGIVKLLTTEKHPRKTQRTIRRSIYPLIAMGAPSSSAYDLTDSRMRLDYRRYSSFTHRPSIGRRISLGVLSLLNPSSSQSSLTHRSSRCSFNLHTTQNIIKEEDVHQNHLSTSKNTASASSSYIDLPAITITAAEARIGHQRHHYKMQNANVNDTLQFQSYMKQRVESPEENTKPPAQTEVYLDHQKLSLGELSRRFSDNRSKSDASSPLGSHLCKDGYCELLPECYGLKSEDTECSPCNNNLNSDIYLTEYSKSDVSVLSDNEKNSLLESERSLSGDLNGTCMSGHCNLTPSNVSLSSLTTTV